LEWLKIARNDGPALGMLIEDHKQTRTFAGRGGSVFRNKDKGLSARSRMARDVKDIRSKFGRKYNRGMLEMLQYAKTQKAYRKAR
jgi:hypothetical protein